MLESHCDLHQFDHVDHVGQIVEDQLHAGLPVATPVAVPQLDRLEAVHALDRWVTPEPQVRSTAFNPPR